MKKVIDDLFVAFFLILIPTLLSAKDLPKVAVWNLEERNMPAAYAKELTSILVSGVRGDRDAETGT